MTSVSRGNISPPNPHVDALEPYRAAVCGRELLIISVRRQPLRLWHAYRQHCSYMTHHPQTDSITQLPLLTTFTGSVLCVHALSNALKFTHTHACISSYFRAKGECRWWLINRFLLISEIIVLKDSHDISQV